MTTRVLVVGAGAVGQVYGRHARQGGADVTFFVREKYRDTVSRGFDIYKRKTDASSLATGAYSTDAIGGGIKFAYPVAETTSVDFGVGLESTELRIFDDAEGRTNLSLLDVGGEALVVSQFTLYADTRRGRRPGFTGAAAPAFTATLVP